MTNAPTVPTSDALASPVRMRTSAQERQRASAVIEGSVSGGTLSVEEGQERLATAQTAIYRDELQALIADLPLGQSHPLWRSRGRDGTARGALAAAYYAAAGFIARHRFWTVVVALVLVAGIAVAVVLGWNELGGGFGHGGGDHASDHALRHHPR